MKPQRIQLRRTRGWRMPPNTVKVDRTTKWGNPFIVGTQGNAAECVYWYAMMACGYLSLSSGSACFDRQRAALEALKGECRAELRGKNLACWCPVGAPCHADLLLEIANKRRRQLDIGAFMARYGWRIVDGKAERIEAAA